MEKTESGRQNTKRNKQHVKEIPSSLDLRPLGQRYGDKFTMQKSRPNSKYSTVKSKTDTGIKAPKTVMETENLRVTKLKGENFGRIAHNVLAKYITEGEP